MNHGGRADTLDSNPNGVRRIGHEQPNRRRSSRGGRCDKTRRGATSDEALRALLASATSKVDRDASVFVGLNGDRFDAVRPAFERGFVKVARPVVGVDARSVEDLRAQVVAQPGKTALVEHQRGAFLPVDAFRFQVREQVVLL